MSPSIAQLQLLQPALVMVLAGYGCSVGGGGGGCGGGCGGGGAEDEHLPPVHETGLEKLHFDIWLPPCGIGERQHDAGAQGDKLEQGDACIQPVGGFPGQLVPVVSIYAPTPIPLYGTPTFCLLKFNTEYGIFIYYWRIINNFIRFL